MDYTRTAAVQDMINAWNEAFLNKYQYVLDSIKKAACNGEKELKIKATSEEEAWELYFGLRERDFDIYIYDDIGIINLKNIWNTSNVFKNDYRMIIRWGS